LFRRPNHDGQGVARQCDGFARREAGREKPVAHVAVPESEPAMGMAVAQGFQLVGCEIGDQQAPAKFST
jgi:hypothetical protein